VLKYLLLALSLKSPITMRSASKSSEGFIIALAFCGVASGTKPKPGGIDLGIVRNMTLSELGYGYRTMSIRKDTTADILSIALGQSMNQRPNRVSSWSLFTSELDKDGAIVPKSGKPRTMWPWHNSLSPNAKGTGSAQDQTVFEWAVLGDNDKLVSYETATNIMIPVGTQDDLWTYYTMDTSAKMDCDFASKPPVPQGWLPDWEANYTASNITTMGGKAKAYLTVQHGKIAPWVFNSKLCSDDQHADNKTSFAADGTAALLKELVRQMLEEPYQFPEGMDPHNEILIKDMMMKDDKESQHGKDFIKAMVLPYDSNSTDRGTLEKNVNKLWEGLKGLEVSWWTFAGTELNPGGKPGKMVSILDDTIPACTIGDKSNETVNTCCEKADEGVKAYCEILSQLGYHVRPASISRTVIV